MVKTSVAQFDWMWPPITSLTLQRSNKTWSKHIADERLLQSQYLCRNLLLAYEMLIWQHTSLMSARQDCKPFAHMLHAVSSTLFLLQVRKDLLCRRHVWSGLLDASYRLCSAGMGDRSPSNCSLCCWHALFWTLIHSAGSKGRAHSRCLALSRRQAKLMQNLIH